MTTGWPTLITVWLSDYAKSGDTIGRSMTTITAPDGVKLPSVVVQVPARTAGSWHLWASADDARGCHAQTGLVRTVTVP